MEKDKGRNGSKDKGTMSEESLRKGDGDVQDDRSESILELG